MLHKLYLASRRRLVPLIMLLACMSLPGEAQEKAKTLTADDLAAMLQNKAPEPSALDTKNIERLQRNRLVVEEAGRKSASGQAFTVQERRKLTHIGRDEGYASVDLEIYFDFDTDAITSQAKRQLVALGQALMDGRLAGARFLLGGHTDAKGSNAYNLDLSERRAQAVRRFLAATFDIDHAKLIAVGFGEEELKNPRAPEAAENRRVQIVNVSR